MNIWGRDTMTRCRSRNAEGQQREQPVVTEAAQIVSRLFEWWGAA